MTKELNKYRSIWVEEKENHWLIESGGGSFSIFKVSEKGFITIENDELFQAVIEKLQSVGAKELTSTELNQYLMEHVFFTDDESIE